MFPNDKTSTRRYDIHVTREVWIDAADFRAQDAKGYFGLAPNKTVMLRSESRNFDKLYSSLQLLPPSAFDQLTSEFTCRYAGFATCQSYETTNGRVSKVLATFEGLDGRKPPKVCLPLPAVGSH